MSKVHETFEKIANLAFGCVWAGCAAGAHIAVDPAALLPIAIGAAGLIGVAASEFAKAGPESKRKLDRIRRRVKKEVESKATDYKSLVQVDEVDSVLGDELLKCFLDREALVQAAADPIGFPARATELVMTALALQRPDLFDDKAPKAGRDYAQTVISTALWSAIDDRDYFEDIQARLSFTQSREIARILESNGRIETAVRRVEYVTMQAHRAVEAGREEIRTHFQLMFALLQAQRIAGITPNPSLRDRSAIEDALKSRDPEHRRTAYLARGILNMARATHELVLELRQLRPALDQFQRKNDEFADSVFEGELLRAEGKLGEAINSFERAVALKPSDGLATVELANALMDRGMLPAADGGEWDADRGEWGASFRRAGEILLPILNAGYSPSNPGFLPAAWSYSHWWFHLAGAGVSQREATLRSTQALMNADEAEPNNPITLRLLGRNLHKFAEEPSPMAETYFKRAIDTNPADIKQKFYYALFLTESNRDDEAAIIFEQCLGIDPDDPHVLEAFAFLLSKVPADTARAELMWRHALRISPKHAVGWKRYGRFLALLPGAFSRAEDVFLLGLASRPNDGALGCEYAVLLEGQPGREADAIAAYENVLALYQDAVEPKVRCIMHKILAGVIDDPAGAGLLLVNEGFTRNDDRLVIAGAWLGALYSRDQEGALTLLKSLTSAFGKHMGFLIQSRNIEQAISAGNRFSAWLDPLSRAIAGELPLRALDQWDAWATA